MVLHVFTSFLGGVPLCIPYGLYSGTSLGGTTWRTLGGYPGRVLSRGTESGRARGVQACGLGAPGHADWGLGCALGALSLFLTQF